MDKQAQIYDFTQKVIYWMIAAFVLAMVTIGLVILLGDYRNGLVSVPEELEAKLITERFTGSADCFAYNGSGVVQRKTLDMEKFTEERLNLCYRTHEDDGYKDYNFKLSLREGGENLTTNNYFNVPHFTFYQPVFVYEDGQRREDVLIITIQVEVPYRESYVEE